MRHAAWGVTMYIPDPVERMEATCADCGCRIGEDRGPPDGWQLEDGRTVCQACCVKDTKRIVDAVNNPRGWERIASSIGSPKYSKSSNANKGAV